MNDNRHYLYSLNSISKREEFLMIKKIIPAGSKVIDLGCGDGTLLQLLKDKNINGEGIDISPTGVRSTRKKGIKASLGMIDASLPYNKKEFDFAICNVTLQMVMYPEILIQEMLRISKNQIISFPNFAFIVNRIELLLKGRMPKSMMGGYEWYSTGHIHQLSIADFIDHCNKKSIHIKDVHYIFPPRIFFIPNIILKFLPNLFASSVVFVIEAK